MPSFCDVQMKLERGAATFSRADVEFLVARCQEARAILLEDGWEACEVCSVLIDTGSDGYGTDSGDDGVYFCAKCMEE